MLDKKHFNRIRQSTRNNIGNQIHQLRSQKQMTLLELSNLCGTGPYILEKWELGKGFLDLYRLEGIARVFDKQLAISFEPLPKDS